MDSSEQFGQNVRQQRAAQRISQEQLAARAGLHSTEVSRLERGVRDPRLSTIVRIAAALDLPAGELLHDVR